MKRAIKSLTVIAVLIFAMPAFAQEETLAQEEEPAELGHQLEIYDAKTFEKQGDVYLDQTYEDISFQVVDFDGNGTTEIIVGSSAQSMPEVIFFDVEGNELTRWMVYGEGYQGGVVIEVADVNNDGKNELITGTRESGGPHIRVFNQYGDVINQWFAFDPASRAGLTLAVGDVSPGTPGKEIVVGHGEGQQSLLRVYSYRGELLAEWYPFTEEFYGGLQLAIAPDGKILVSREFGDGPLVRVYDGYGALAHEFLAYYDGFEGGVQTQAIIQPHGGWDIYTAPGFSGGPHMRNFTSDGRLLSPGFNAFGGDFHGGLVFDVNDIDRNGDLELIIAKATYSDGPFNTLKSIIIDLSEQRLTTYYRGSEQNSYIISSGLNRFPTPQGEFSVYRKRDSTRMSWFYGENNPDNYDLENVPDVLSFYGPYNIHGAYWHNNFGVQMSHGCINMALPDAAEVYGWAEIGTTVTVQP